MDSANDKSLGTWVDERVSSLDLDNTWQPNVSAGLAQLHQKLSEKQWHPTRWIWAAATVAVILLTLLILPPPQVLAHRCLECSVAVWQALSSSTANQTELTSQRARGVAPDFSLEDAEGKTVKLSNLKNKVVLLNFWATWCEGCQTEIPWFIDFQKEYAERGLVVVGISMDDDGWKSVRPWLKQKNVNYPIVIGSQSLGKQYGLDGMPLTVLIDRDGKIAGTHPGLIDKTTTDQKLQALLK